MNRISLHGRSWEALSYCQGRSLLICQDLQGRSLTGRYLHIYRQCHVVMLIVLQTTYQTTSSVPLGDCLVSTNGKPCSVEWIKRKILELNLCKRLTVTLDMCRNTGCRSVPSPREEMLFQLPNLTPIPNNLAQKLGVIYGTAELHFAIDYRSFTQTMHKVVKENLLSLSFSKIPSLVNQEWEASGVIKQRCKGDFLEVGDNWDTFLWPSEVRGHSYIT